MSFKVDLHTHSSASPDGSLSAADYRRMLEDGKLDCIAVTDHNDTDLARELHEAFGERIIVGEEITTSEGEVIGLYLTDTVRPHMSAAETVAAIHDQGGLVYIPHPFETLRKGLSEQSLVDIAKSIDIIEIHNGRAVFQNRSREAGEWASGHHLPGAAASDAHGKSGWGKTYTIVHEMPTRDNLVKLLAGATYRRRFPGLRGVSYPKYNRLRKKLGYGHAR